MEILEKSNSWAAHRPDSSAAAAVKAAFPATIPVLTGYICLGMAFGILIQTSGYGVGWALLMSVVCFAGSGQFLGVTLLTAAFDPVQALLLSVMINARHIFTAFPFWENTGAWAGPGRS